MGGGGGGRRVCGQYEVEKVRKNETQAIYQEIFIWFPFFRFLGNDISDNSDMALIVRVDSESVPTVKFSKDEELQKLLCEVPILKTRPASSVQIAPFSKCSF